jgi:predicted methyltransferase
MLRAVDLARLLLGRIVKPGDWVVDATVGNGHDTLWLAHLVGPDGRVFGFDVQAKALAQAAERVQGLSQVALLHADHQRLAELLPADAKGRLVAVMFNLGYLPGADKAIATSASATLGALQQALNHLTIGGQITLVLYPGHTGGAEETAAVRAFAAELPGCFTAARYGWINTLRAGPELVVIERSRE